jgi:hypothetical protein
MQHWRADIAWTASGEPNSSAADGCGNGDYGKRSAGKYSCAGEYGSGGSPDKYRCPSRNESPGGSSRHSYHCLGARDAHFSAGNRDFPSIAVDCANSDPAQRRRYNSCRPRQYSCHV